MSRRPRVLVITPDFPPARGGIQLLINRIVRHAERVESRVVTIGDGAARAWDSEQGMSVIRSRAMLTHRGAVLGLNALALREALRFRPDVVLAAHIVASPAAWAITTMLGVPIVLYLYAKEVGASPRLTSFALRHSTAAIVISDYTRDLALAAGARPEQLRKIPPGVDIVDVERVPRLDTPTILTIARLEDRYKGHDVLVRALPLIRARVPDAQWVVVGDGSVRADICRLAAAHRVTDAVKLIGSVSDADRNWWLDRSHVFAMPSRLPAGRSAGEGFGIVYLEAGLHGVPVVAGGVGGALDAIRDGETGLLVDPTSPLEVADAIADLLEDRERARALGEAGREYARRFSWDRIVPQVEDVLLEVAGRAR
jgi:phosphatidylinositol alpha-1,6-mannosyltransferase